MEELLEALIAGVGDDQRFENGEDLAAVLDDALDDFAGFGNAEQLALPLGQDLRGHINVLAQFFRRMPAQKQPEEERGFALRVVEIVL